MKFHNKVSKERRIMLTYDLNRYIAEVKMSDCEYEELCQWVQAGNSPYDNGWNIATEAGTPMDYINARRTVYSAIDNLGAVPVQVCNDPLSCVLDDDCSNIDNLFPF